jgi:hypothetical protein
MPAKALIDTFSDDDFAKVVAESKNMTEICQKIGYAAKSGANQTRVRKRIDELKLSTDHFNISNRRPVKRCP